MATDTEAFSERLSGEEEPLVDPEVAAFWLVETDRGYINKQGDLRLRPDRRLDPQGATALAIARDGEPRLFSQVYGELTGEKALLIPDAVKDLGHEMIKAYIEANSNGHR